MISNYKKKDLPGIDDVFSLAYGYFTVAQSTDDPGTREAAVASMGAYSSFGFLLYFLTDDGYFDDEPAAVQEPQVVTSSSL